MLYKKGFQGILNGAVKKRKFILIIGLVFFSLILNAAPISESTAKTVALNFLRNRTSSEILRKAKSVKLIYKYYDSVTTYIYVFNVYPIGFIVISGDNRVMPVLSYSDESSFDTSMNNKSAAQWFEGYKNQIKYAIENNVHPTDEIQNTWKELNPKAIKLLKRKKYRKKTTNKKLGLGILNARHY
jgi:hypothetical protein